MITQLSDELLIDILLYLNISNIPAACLTSKQFNRIINTKDFWRNKFKQDYLPFFKRVEEKNKDWCESYKKFFVLPNNQSVLKYFLLLTLEFGKENSANSLAYAAYFISKEKLAIDNIKKKHLSIKKLIFTATTYNDWFNLIHTLRSMARALAAIDLPLKESAKREEMVLMLHALASLISANLQKNTEQWQVKIEELRCELSDIKKPQPIKIGKHGYYFKSAYGVQDEIELITKLSDYGDPSALAKAMQNNYLDYDIDTSMQNWGSYSTVPMPYQKDFYQLFYARVYQSNTKLDLDNFLKLSADKIENISADKFTFSLR